MHLFEVTFYVVSHVAGGEHLICLASESEDQKTVHAEATHMMLDELARLNIPYERVTLEDVNWLDEDVHTGVDVAGNTHTWRLVYEPSSAVDSSGA